MRKGKKSPHKLKRQTRNSKKRINPISSEEELDPEETNSPKKPTRTTSRQRKLSAARKSSSKSMEKSKVDTSESEE